MDEDFDNWSSVIGSQPTESGFEENETSFEIISSFDLEDFVSAGGGSEEDSEDYFKQLVKYEDLRIYRMFDAAEYRAADENMQIIYIEKLHSEGLHSMFMYGLEQINVLAADTNEKNELAQEINFFLRSGNQLLTTVHGANTLEDSDVPYLTKDTLVSASTTTFHLIRNCLAKTKQLSLQGSGYDNVLSLLLRGMFVSYGIAQLIGILMNKPLENKSWNFWKLEDKSGRTAIRQMDPV